MANNVQTQLQRAIEMKGRAQSFSVELIQKMNQLAEALGDAVRSGFPEDIAETYRGGYYAPDRAIIEDLSRDMQSRHVDFLDRVISHLQKATVEK